MARIWVTGEGGEGHWEETKSKIDVKPIGDTTETGLAVNRPKQPAEDDPNLNLQNGANSGTGTDLGSGGGGGLGGADATGGDGGLGDVDFSDLPSFEDRLGEGEAQRREAASSGFVDRKGNAITDQATVDAIQQILQTDGSLTKEEAVRIHTFNTANGITGGGSADPAGDLASSTDASDADLSNAGEEESYEFGGVTSADGKRTTVGDSGGTSASFSTSGTFNYDGVEVFNYDEITKLLTAAQGGGALGDIISNYNAKIEAGDPDLPSILIEDTNPESDTFGQKVDTDVAFGTDVYKNQGWGYYTTKELESPVVDSYGDPVLDDSGNPVIETTYQEEFVIDGESMKAGLIYDRLIENFDNMQRFAQNAALATDASARDLLIRQEMARVEDQYASQRQAVAHFNALDVISAQQGGQEELQKASQNFANNQRILQQNFSQDERDAIQRWQEEQRTGETGTQSFTTSERLAIQEWQSLQRTGEGGTQEFQTGERVASQDEAERIREIEAGIRELEISSGRTFTTDERKAIQAFQVSREEISRSQQLEDQRTGQAFATGERQAGETFSAGQADINRGFVAGESELGREAASARQEDTQEFEGEQARLSENFQIRRDEIRFDMDSRLESARLGIADATSDEGIQQAVKLAQEARDLERTMAAVDIVERIALNPAMKRSLEQSGVLAALEEEFGIDLSFVLGGGLGTGGGGRSPVRITA